MMKKHGLSKNPADEWNEESKYSQQHYNFFVNIDIKILYWTKSWGYKKQCYFLIFSFHIISVNS